MIIKTKHTGNVKGSKLPPEVLTAEEVEAIVDACSRRGLCGIRNRALILVIYRGMLRINEALSLKPSDVDLDDGTIRVRNGKGAKARTVGIPGSVCDAISRWAEKRKGLGINGGSFLFCGIENGKTRSNLGEKLDSSYIRHLLPRLAKIAGIEKRVHPHGFRHSGAVRMLRAGLGVDVISRGLGHSNIAVTDRYINHLHPQAVVDAMKEE